MASGSLRSGCTDLPFLSFEASDPVLSHEATVHARLEQKRAEMRPLVSKRCLELSNAQLGDRFNSSRCLSPGIIFGCLHLIALMAGICGVYLGLQAAIVGAAQLSIVNIGIFVRLGYPMIPVILGCACCQARWRPTPGYYFANLKMALMISLGPGVFCALGNEFVLRLWLRSDISPAYLDDRYTQLLSPLSWIFGCAFFLCLRNPIFAILGNDVERQERLRPDYGMYARWVVKPAPEKPPLEWITVGPAWMLLIFPVPRYGGFQKILRANQVRCIGVTICCSACWCILLVFGLAIPQHKRVLQYLVPEGSAVQEFIHRDMPSLFFNLLTAPFLIYDTWRYEPVAAETITQNGKPILIFDNTDTELEQILASILAEMERIGTCPRTDDNAPLGNDRT